MPSALDHIWNGWRASYVQGLFVDPEAKVEPGKSVFRQILESGLDDDDTNIVHRGRECFAILNAFPYTVGHLLVLPYRQVPTLDQLSASESAEVWQLTQQGVAAIDEAYHPAGINVGLNMGAAAGGSVSEHLHLHVLPRWVGDANFTTTVANARTIPEPLADTATKLRAAWPASH